VRASRVTPSTKGVTRSSETPPLGEHEPNFQTHKILRRIKIWSWVPTGSETKNDCAGEDQQQFSGLNWHVASYRYELVVRWKTAGDEARTRGEESTLLRTVTRQRLVRTWKFLCVLQYSNL
jgi:hypothetical protein